MAKSKRDREILSALAKAGRDTASAIELMAERDILADYARGKDIHNATKRARLGYVVQGILRDHKITTYGLSDRDLATAAGREAAVIDQDLGALAL